MTMLAAGDVDYIDPGQSYYQFGYQVIYATQRPLYSYKADSATEVTPDLASGPPEVSADNKSITVHIRKGIHYSPPLADREVTSADVKYAFERAFTKQVPERLRGHVLRLAGRSSREAQHRRLRTHPGDRDARSPRRSSSA